MRKALSLDNGAGAPFDLLDFLALAILFLHADPVIVARAIRHDAFTFRLSFRVRAAAPPASHAPAAPATAAARPRGRRATTRRARP